MWQSFQKWNNLLDVFQNLEGISTQVWSHVLSEIGSFPGQKSVPLTMFFFSAADPTRITQGPVDMEIIVGESIVLPCQVASDPVLDVSFSWAFNGQLISKGDGHFELVGGVSDRSHISSERANGQLAPLPILLHFISAIS